MKYSKMQLLKVKNHSVSCNSFDDLFSLISSFQNVTKAKITNFPDKPKVQLSFGSQLEASNIKEGNDVYFECKVKSHPRHYKITWKRNVSIH